MDLININIRRMVGVVLMVVVAWAQLVLTCNGNYVFKVQHKYYPGRGSLTAFKAHDLRRHFRLLAALDLPLGGTAYASQAGLYFTKIALGNPSKDYYVQVDTGSDILWVNCINCDKCPKKSELGVHLTLYDPKSSTASSKVYCADNFCTSTYNGMLPGCTKDILCQYSVLYGDGSTTAGYFVKDAVQLDMVSGSPMNGSVIFGCGAQQSGELGSSSEALDGILGFGQANSSMLSQLAAEGKVKKVFSHCLDNVNGGGIFTIGEVVSPKVDTTPLVPNHFPLILVTSSVEVDVAKRPDSQGLTDEWAHYNVVLKDIEVGGTVLDLPSDVFDTGDRKGTIIDSGTTLAYLPEVVYELLMTKILAAQPQIKLHLVEGQFQCFHFSANLDNAFPDVTFHFQGSLTLKAYPHDYLFQFEENVWCFGWQNSGLQSKEGKDMTLLGDLVLSNKLVVYDLENQVIGWTEHNCSSSIQVKGDDSGSTYSVNAQNLSSAASLISRKMGTLFLLFFGIIILHRFV